MSAFDRCLQTPVTPLTIAVTLQNINATLLHHGRADWKFPLLVILERLGMNVVSEGLSYCWVLHKHNVTLYRTAIHTLELANGTEFRV